ncbi:hypothetical protein [Corynebacterium sputi]|uniref:hypothetical protein n=1 Tax=Corynebacterium sputi TaxID=489915 RepID=UPI00040FB0A6|nr:hypothetical protein [Corynebacterium sputi]
MSVSHIHPDTDSYRVGVEQIVKDLYPAIAKEDGINVPDTAYRPIAEELASDLKDLGVAPADFSLTRWLSEFGVSALVDFLQMHEQIPEGDSAWEVTWFEGNVTIADSTGATVVLPAAQAVRVAAAITDRAALSLEEPTPFPAAS